MATKKPQTNKATIAGYLKTHLGINIVDGDLIPQIGASADNWKKFFVELDNNIVDEEKLPTFTKEEKKRITTENINNKQKIYDLAIKYNLFKNGDPKAQPVSQEVKSSAILPFLDDPDAPSSSGPPPMQEQLGIITPTIDDGKQQAGSLLASMFKDKSIMTKMKKAVKTGREKTRTRTAKQEQELKEAQVKIANLDRIAELKMSRLEQETKSRLIQQENFYKNQMKAQRDTTQGLIDPKEVARQLEEYKTRLETEQRQKDQDLIDRLEQQYKATLEQEKKARLELQKQAEEEQKTSYERFERLKKLAKEKEDKYQLTLKEKEAEKLKELKEQKQTIKTLFDASTSQAVRNLEKTAETKINRNEQKLNQLKMSLEKLMSAKNVDTKKIESLKFQIEDLNQAELNRQNLEYNVWDVLDYEDAAEIAIAQQKMSELEQKRKEKELKKAEFEKAQLASQLKQTVEIKEREQKIEPIITYLDNVTPFLTAPLLVLASNLLTGAKENKDTAISTVLASGTLALMNYLRTTFRPEEIKQALELAKTLPVDKRVNKILKQAKAMPKPSEDPPEPSGDPPDPSGPAGGPADIPDEKGIDTRLLVAGGAAVGIGGGMLARKASDSLPNFRQFFKGDFTMPGYNFLGPGTDLKERIASGLLPVDLLDKIAYEHDLLYSLAKNENQIREADEIMIKSIDKYLPGSIFAQGIKNILQLKIDNEKKSLMDFSNKILEENKKTTKQQINIYDTLLNEITYDQPTTTNIGLLEPELQPPEPVQDIKTTEPITTIETMPPKIDETKTEVKATTTPTIRGAVKTRPVVYNPPPAIGPDRSRVGPAGGRNDPYKTIVEGKQVAPLRGAGFPDRTITSQSDYINDDEIK